MVLVAVLLVCQADVIDEPGAKMSRQVPKLENDDRASAVVVEPTVIASATLAGDWCRRSCWSCPQRWHR